MKYIRFTIILILVLVSAFFFAKAAISLSKEDFSKLPKLGSEKEAYAVHSEEYIPREKIKDFIVDSGKIYVFYEKSALVNVYKTDGSFEYAVQISTMENGKGGIALADGKLYFCSRYAIIFVFEDGQLLETIDLWSSAESLERDRMIRDLAEREPNHSEGQNTYTLMEAENDIVIAGGGVVLDFPEISPAGDFGVMGIGVIGVLEIALELFRKKNTKNSAETVRSEGLD